MLLGEIDSPRGEKRNSHGGGLGEGGANADAGVGALAMEAHRVRDEISRRGERIKQRNKKKIKKEKNMIDEPTCQSVISLFMSSNPTKHKT